MTNINNNTTNISKDNNITGNAFTLAKEREIKEKKAEKARKEAEAKAAKEQAEADKKAKEKADHIAKLLKGVKEVGISGAMKDVAAKEISTPKNEDGSQRYGVVGNGYLIRFVTIEGKGCMIMGRNEAELKADYDAAVKTFKHLGDNMARNVRTAEQLVDAGYKSSDIEEVDVEGRTVLISYKEKAVRDLDGEILVTLDNISSKLDKADIKTLLVERVKALPKDESRDDDCNRGCSDDGRYEVIVNGRTGSYFDDLDDAIDCIREWVANTPRGCDLDEYEIRDTETDEVVEDNDSLDLE